MKKNLPGPWWYMWLYLRLGGKPFTWATRGFTREYPAVVGAAYLAMLYMVWRWLSWKGFIIFAVAFALGHIHWGAKRYRLRGDKKK